MKQNWVSIVGLVLTLVLAGYVITNKQVATVTPSDVSSDKFGASSGPDHYSIETFYGGLMVGRGVAASSTAASVTLAGTEFQNADVLDYTVNVANKTLTLPASTTPFCTSIPKGLTRTVYIRHASTTVSNTLTIAGGTGTELKNSSSTAILYGDGDGSAEAKLVIYRRQNLDCNVLFTPFN